MSQPGAPRLVLLAHQPLGQAMHQLALHAFSDCAASVEWVDIDAQASRESAQALLRERLRSQPERPTLVLVDVAGATPANALQALLPELPAVRAVAGLNVAMLWRVLCYRHEALPQLAERALAGGQRGILELSAPG